MDKINQKDKLAELHKWKRDSATKRKQNSTNPFYYCKNLPLFFQDTPVRWSPKMQVPYLPFDFLIDTSEPGEFAKTARISLADIMPIDGLMYSYGDTATASQKNNIANKTRKACANRIISFLISFLEETLIKEKQWVINLRYTRDIYQFKMVKHKHPRKKSYDMGLGVVSKRGSKMFFLNQQDSDKCWKKNYLHELYFMPEIIYKQRTK